MLIFLASHCILSPLILSPFLTSNDKFLIIFSFSSSLIIRISVFSFKFEEKVNEIEETEKAEEVEEVKEETPVEEVEEKEETGRLLQNTAIGSLFLI